MREGLDANNLCSCSVRRVGKRGNTGEGDVEREAETGVSAPWGMCRVTGYTETRGQEWNRLSLQDPEGGSTSDTLISDLWPISELRVNEFLLF